MALGETVLAASIYSPPVPLRKHRSLRENQVPGGRRCDLGLLASALTSLRRGQSLVSLGVLGALLSPRAQCLNVNSVLLFINWLALSSLLNLSETQFLHL